MLLAFEHGDGLEKLAKSLSRDPTVVSRVLKRIAEKSDVLEKVAGRWKLTDSGHKLNSLTKDMIYAQRALLTERTTLRIGSNREFVSRVLVKSLRLIKKDLGLESIAIKSYENGTEKALIEGQIDVAFDCGKPYSPEVAFKACINEPISIICSPKFYSLHKEQFEKQDYKNIPMLLCERLFPERIDSQEYLIDFAAFHFNDISAARSACVEGLGWMFAPLYSVEEEIKSKKLMRPYNKNWGNEKYSVWWLRSRKQLAPQVKKMEQWLMSQHLG